MEEVASGTTAAASPERPQQDAPAAAASSGRSMRQRKAGPPMLEGMAELPAGTAKPPRTSAPKKGGAKAAASKSSKSKGKAAGTTSASASSAAAPIDSVQQAFPDFNDDGSMAMYEQEIGGSAMGDAGDGEDDNTLYCICLERDDGRPLIQCEGCQNWYHFPCINLTEEQALNIASYYCAICEQAGIGHTEWNAPPDSTTESNPLYDQSEYSQPIATLPSIPLPLPVHTPSDSGDETDDYFGGSRGPKAAIHSSEEEYSDSGTGSKRKKAAESAPSRRRSGTGGCAAGKRRKAVIEDDDEREERRKQSTVEQSRFYSRAPAPPAGEQTAENNKTRRHAIDQLELSLKAIFALPTPASTPTGTEDPSHPAAADKPTPEQAREHACKVEADLFLNFHEIDEKDKRTRIPGRKYISKFRTLNFNLKGNDYFRSRIASGTLDAAAIVAMAQEDLLTPEARAAQEAAKEKSLAQSVKSAAVQPKTRFTKKGEEVLDEFDAAGTKIESSRAQPLGDTTPGAGGDASYMSDMRERSRSMSLAAGSPGVEQSPRFGSPPANEGMSPTASESPFPRAFSPVEMGPPSAKKEGDAGTPAKADSSATSERRPSLVQHSRSDSQSKSKIDLDSIWGAYKSPVPKPSEATSKEEEEAKAEPKDEDDMEIGGGSDAEKEAELKDAHADDFDPFSQGSKRDTDEDFDAIMNADEPAAAAAAASEEGSASQSEAEAKIASLPTIWQGAVIHPEEGGFPGRAVQLFGPNLGVHPQIWSQILPAKQLDVSARIDVKSASDYLVQAHFAPKRELAILALIADGEPDPAASESSGKPTVEKAEKGFNHLLSYFHEKKRYGVCPPGDALKAVTKDHYIVPLRKDDPLPDYIELLDDFPLAETGSRTKDYLLSVLVLSKGAWQGAAPPVAGPRSSGGTTPIQSQPSGQSPRHDPRQSVPGPPVVGPGGVPQPPNPNLPNIDPNALQSLLANPALLQALQANPQQQQNNFGQSPMGPQQPGMPFSGNGGRPQNSPPWNGPSGPSPQQWQGPPPPGHWNPAGSPTWHGPPGPGWGPQQGPPPGMQGGPGFIHPERIKQASREAAEMAARGQQRGGPGGFRDDRYDGRRDDRGGDYRRQDAGRDRDRRPRNSDYTRGPGPQGGHGPPRGGNGGQRDREGSDPRNQRGGNGKNNQMNAGIADRGWGGRS